MFFRFFQDLFKRQTFNINWVKKILFLEEFRDVLVHHFVLVIGIRLLDCASFWELIKALIVEDSDIGKHQLIDDLD